ncbi:uncharacterized protein L201_006048 [Kwoniella dendrophila CBS 6074]|uniref:Uncharacterized protein n=1 Tax=Kwoniella dendrophila CBS 6074 TaxID=1295534 RepID=A0AAX4K2J4_9TREE
MVVTFQQNQNKTSLTSTSTTTSTTQNLERGTIGNHSNHRTRLNKKHPLRLSRPSHCHKQPKSPLNTTVQPNSRPSYGSQATAESGAFSYDDEYYEGEEEPDIEEELAKLEEEYLSAEEEEIDLQMGENTAGRK